VAIIKIILIIITIIIKKGQISTHVYSNAPMGEK